MARSRTEEESLGTVRLVIKHIQRQRGAKPICAVGFDVTEKDADSRSGISRVMNSMARTWPEFIVRLPDKVYHPNSSAKEIAYKRTRSSQVPEELLQLLKKDAVYSDWTKMIERSRPSRKKKAATAPKTAASTKTKTVTDAITTKCPECDGGKKHFGANGSDIRKCFACGGTGDVDFDRTENRITYWLKFENKATSLRMVDKWNAVAIELHKQLTANEFRKENREATI